MAANVKVGPFFEGDQQNIEQFRSHRKPSKEVLESVRLRPSYFSFPRDGTTSPSTLCIKAPKYTYSSIDSSPPIYLPSPESPPRFIESLGKISILSATLNSINYFIGIGVLGMPYTLKLFSWYGIIEFFIIGIIMSYCAILLGKCQNKLSLSTYPDIAEASYGNYGRLIVSVLFYIHLIFDMALFMITLTNSIDIIFQTHIKYSSNHILIIVTLLLIILSNFVTNIEIISKFSAIGTCSTLIICCLVLIVCLVRILSKNDMVTVLKIPKFSLWEVIQNSLRCYGVYSFCFMGHGVLPSIFKNMKHPSRFTSVIYITFATTIISYAIVASVGYAAFGPSTQSDLLSNFENPTIRCFITLLAIIMVISKYTLASFPVNEGICDMVQSFVTSNKGIPKRSSSISLIPINYQSGNFTEETKEAEYFEPKSPVYLNVFLRTIIPLFPFALAIAIPNFIKLLSIIGIVFGTIISVIIPILCYFKIYKDEMVTGEWIVLSLILIVVILISFCSITLTHI